MKIGDLVRFSDGRLRRRMRELGILVAVSQPEGLEKPIAAVFWTSEGIRMQHLAEELEAVNENR